MPGWNELLTEIEELHKQKDPHPLDTIRRKYLKKLYEKRGRNIIAYYSGWIQLPQVGGTEIEDSDKNAFMTVIHKLDRKKGLDLILHTQGGQIAVTESLVDYLRKMFDLDIEIFIPQIAMSAGTMIACSGRKNSYG